MPELIRSHVWRAPANCRLYPGVPCAYMSCGRPRAEHERAVSGRYRP